MAALPIGLSLAIGTRRCSLRARQDLLQVGEEFLPTELGTLEGLLLVAAEARLLHAQMRSRAGRRERPGDDAFESHRVPSLRQRLVRLDFKHLAIDGAPIAAQIEAVIDDRLKIVLHQPFLDQVRLSARSFPADAGCRVRR